MNKKGFTLVELLAVLVIIAIVFTISFYILKDTMAASVIQMDEAVENEIYEAANAYVIETNKPFNSEGYTCVTVKDLIDYGYVKEADYLGKIIRVERNNQSKVIEVIKYVDECD